MITELFALPIGLKSVAKFDSEELYSSDSIKEKVIEVMKESELTKPVANDLVKLINDNKIIPIFSNSGIIEYIATKIFPSEKRYTKTLAFFSPEKKKIYLWIDNNINLIGYVKNNWIAVLVLHELMHMVASFKPNYFIVTFKPQLLIFYKELYIKIFKLKDSNKLDFLVEDIYKTMFNKVETKRVVDFKTFTTKFNLLRKYSSLDKFEFDKVLMDYFRIIKFHLSNKYDLIYTNTYKYILKEPYNVYREKFNINLTNKNCVQEFFLPSEVICTLIEYNQAPSMYAAIKSIAK